MSKRENTHPPVGVSSRRRQLKTTLTIPFLFLTGTRLAHIFIKEINNWKSNKLMIFSILLYKSSHYIESSSFV